MNTKPLLELSLFIQGVLCLTTLSVMLYRRSFRVFPQLGYYLGVQGLSALVSIAFLFFRREMHASQMQAYNILFCSYWVSSVLSFALRILIVYSVFAEAMRPFSGLHRAGKVVFCWAAAVSGLVSLALVAGPQVFVDHARIADLLSRLQQGLSVLVLCLLVLVCFAIRPLGLTFRSHIFGVSLGLGVAATVELVQTAWFVTSGALSPYSPIYLFASVGFCVALMIWGTYFTLPEPRRQMILLPTTSPFFFWNRISEILGDAPGQVAVAGFSPEMLAPAEIEMLTAATSAETLPKLGEHTSSGGRADSAFLPEFATGSRPFLAL